MAFDYKAFLHKDPEGLAKKIKQKPKVVDPNKARDANRAKALSSIDASLKHLEAGERKPKRGDYREEVDHDGSSWAYFKVRVGRSIAKIEGLLENAVPFEHLKATLTSIRDEITKGHHDTALADANATKVHKKSSAMRSSASGGDKRYVSPETIARRVATRKANREKKLAEAGNA